MSDRPTPETDAARAEESRVTGGQSLYLVHYRVAERLERERDEARELARELASRIEQILLCKSGPHGWVVGNLSLAAKRAEGSMVKAREVLEP